MPWRRSAISRKSRLALLTREVTKDAREPASRSAPLPFLPPPDYRHRAPPGPPAADRADINPPISPGERAFSVIGGRKEDALVRLNINIA
jgi:hypothetical protein